MKRYYWAVEQICNQEQFNDVIWTDESKIEICKSAPKSFRKEGTLAKPHGKPKHPVSVSIHGGFIRPEFFN